MISSISKKISAGWLIFWATLSLLVGGKRPEFDLPHALAHPSWEHWLGCEAFGRDLIALLCRASLKSMSLALAIVGVSSVISLALGISLAMAPTRWRFTGQRLLEGLLAFPSLIMALAWAAIRGPGWDTLLFALSIGVLPSFTRLIFVRAQEILQEEYISAAYAAGASTLRVGVRHLAPALRSICLMALPNLFAHTLIAEATLSFLGVGAPVGQETWGSLLAQGKDYLIEAPHISTAAGIPLLLTVLSLQLLSERA